MDGAPLLHRIEEGARALRISRSRMFELIAAGEIETVLIGRSRRVPAQALEEYVARLRRQQSSPAA